MSNTEIIQRQREGWNNVSQGWKQLAEKLKEFHDPVSKSLIAALNALNGGVVVDFGTGTGGLGLEIAQQNAKVEVIGLDLSEEMVKIANETAREKGISNYSAHVVNIAEDLSLPVQRVDAVVGQHVAQFLTAPEADLGKLIEIIKPGGKTAWGVWGPALENPWMSTAVGPINQLLKLPKPLPDQPQIFRFSQPDSLSWLLRTVGLKDVKEVLLNGVVTFESPEDYFDFIFKVAPPLRGLNEVTEDIHQQARQAVFNAAVSYIKDNQLSFGWSAWVVSGTKP